MIGYTMKQKLIKSQKNVYFDYLFWHMRMLIFFFIKIEP